MKCEIIKIMELCEDISFSHKKKKKKGLFQLQSLGKQIKNLPERSEKKMLNANDKGTFLVSFSIQM